MNVRERKKKRRIEKIRKILISCKENKLEVDIEKLISQMIVEESVTRRTAKEEIDAIISFEEFKDEFPKEVENAEQIL